MTQHSPNFSLTNQSLMIETLANQVNRLNIETCCPFFSVEFFPPRTGIGSKSFVRLLERYGEGSPLFCDVTWHSERMVDNDIWLETSSTSSLSMANVAVNHFSLETILHITALGMTKQQLIQVCQRAKTLGIRNILALRGDRNEANCKRYAFQHASDLVSFIRHQYGSYFTIAVAGYPYAHPEAPTPQKDLFYLKRKIDAGADFIITQMFFEFEVFARFVEDCRTIGITVPIIPGICAINSYNSLVKFTKLCQVPLPEKLKHLIEPIREDDAAVTKCGNEFLIQLCRDLIDAQIVPGLHFYTLNQVNSIQIIKALGLWRKEEIIDLLPWKKAINQKRLTEFVRPVFWINRPSSYIYRSDHWENYPSISWSHVFSDRLKPSLDQYHRFLDPSFDRKDLLHLELCSSVEQIFGAIYSFYQAQFEKIDPNNNSTSCKQNKLSSLPWIQQPKNFASEKVFLKFGSFIVKGALILNYLPRFNGLKSTDQQFGWGEPNGFIYQKQYIEFFIDYHCFDRLKLILKSTGDGLSYHVSDRNGYPIDFTNWPEKNPIVISWGLFPNFQLIPAYIADQKTFSVWRQEAFELFDQLINCCKNLQRAELHRFLLVSLIDNNFATADNGFEKIIFEKLFQ